MNIIIHLSLVAFTICNNQAHHSVISRVIDTVGKEKISKKYMNSKYFSLQDSVVIGTETGDTLKYSKEEFDRIIIDHPELVTDYAYPPEQVYYCNGENNGFNSQAGQDSYFILYAYFLKKRNGEKEYSMLRKRLINVYLKINLLFKSLELGGSYFGHQATRIVGYAEYAVYLYKQNKIYGSTKTNDITKQKALYIKSLLQIIQDENINNLNIVNQENIKSIKKLNKIVDDIDKAITSSFFLRSVQNFHYGHYNDY
ncbi:MAG: hypothetical protein ABI091_12790 [Ferruginibacter sp.]